MRLSIAHLRRFIRKATRLFDGAQFNAEMRDEMQHHLELQAEEYRLKGLSPDEAAETARRDFGHIDVISETCRDDRTFLWVRQIGQDIGFALRTTLRAPGFFIASALILALGIGANTAIFSLVDETLLRQLPVRDPSSLVLFHWSSSVNFPVPTSGDWEQDPVTQQQTCTSFSKGGFEQMQRAAGDFAEVFAFAPITKISAVVRGQAEEITLGQVVSGNYFQVLGVQTPVGRPIEAADDHPGAPPTAVISDRYWHRRFTGDPNVIGQSILVNGQPFIIVGVLPPRFAGTLQMGDMPDISFPLSFAGRVSTTGHLSDDPTKVWWLQIIARRNAGIDFAQLKARLEASFQESARESLTANDAATPEALAHPPILILGPGGQGLLDLRHIYIKQWKVLTALAATILAIACANIASMLLARSMARRREVGIRMAMGANRGRIVRQLLTESALLAGSGGLLAIPVALAVERAIIAMQPQIDGHTLVLGAGLDYRVLAVTGSVSIATGILFGLAPALRATAVNLTAEFHGGSVGHAGSSRSLLSRSLLVLQFALSVVLLIGAGLFTRTLQNLHNVDIGFNAHGILLFTLDPGSTKNGVARGLQMDREIAERLRSLTGVEAATYSKLPMLSGMGWNTQIGVQGGSKVAKIPDTALVNAVDSHFFSTYGIPLVAGRAMNDQDDGRASVVAVVNQAFSKAFFGTESPVGRFVSQEDIPGKVKSVEIVGVVGDAQYSAIRDKASPTIYFPFSFSKVMQSSDATFAVRCQGDPKHMIPSIRAVIGAVDPLLPMAEVRTQEVQISELSAHERLFAWFSSFFGSLALGLVAFGLYSLMSYMVLRRTNEIGVRIALGASRSSVYKLVLGESLSLAAIGVTMGLVAAYFSTRIVAGSLYGLSSTDPYTFAAATLILLVAAGLAGWIPSRRAASLDPIAALRHE